MIPPGKHKMRCYDDTLVAFGKAKNENAQIAVPMEVVDGAAVGERAWFLGSLGTEDSVKLVFKALRAMGWNNDDVTAPTGLKTNIVIATVEEEVWEGKTRTRIKYIDSADRRFEFKGGLTDHEKLSLGARLRAHAVQSRLEAKPGAASSTNAPMGAPAGAQSAPPPEELPF